MSNDERDVNPAPGASGEMGPMEEGEQGFASASSRRPRPGALRGANLLLAALFAAGIGGLYLLSLRQGPAEASADERQTEVQVDTALARLSAGSVAQTKAKVLVDAFYYQASQRQIPVEDLWGNPFLFTPPQRPEPTTKPADETPKRPIPGARPSGPDPLAEARKLSLQSVLMGTDGRKAMISNNLLGEGQVIRGWTVQTIESRTVVLAREGKTFVLKMQ